MASYLTARQKEILEFIHAFRREKGLAPTHREICERFGFSSYGTAYKHLKLLSEKGFLKRERRRLRRLRQHCRALRAFRYWRRKGIALPRPDRRRQADRSRRRR